MYFKLILNSSVLRECRVEEWVRTSVVIRGLNYQASIPSQGTTECSGGCGTQHLFPFSPVTYCAIMNNFKKYVLVSITLFLICKTGLTASLLSNAIVGFWLMLKFSLASMCRKSYQISALNIMMVMKTSSPIFHYICNFFPH